MSFSIRIPIDKDGKLEAPRLSGDLPLHMLSPVGEGNRSIIVHGHADKDGLTLGMSMGRAHCQMFVPAAAFPKPQAGDECCPTAVEPDQLDEEDERSEAAGLA